MPLLDPLLFFLGTILSVAVFVSWARRFLDQGFAAAVCAGSVVWIGLIVIPQLVLSIFGELNSVTEHALVTLLSALLEIVRAKCRLPEEGFSPGRLKQASFDFLLFSNCFIISSMRLWLST